MSLAIKPIQAKPCFLFHRWHTLKTTGKTRYMQCKDCAARQIEQTRGGYQPVDWTFLDN